MNYTTISDGYNNITTISLNMRIALRREMQLGSETQPGTSPWYCIATLDKPH